MNKEREAAVEILGLVEDMLSNYGLVIDSEDRQEAIANGEEGVAALYGDEYYSLEDQITEIISNIK